MNAKKAFYLFSTIWTINFLLLAWGWQNRKEFPNKPYILVLDHITESDCDACRSDNNCMDIVLLKDFKPSK